MKYTVHRLDHWKIALDIEMQQWSDLLARLEYAIDAIDCQPDDDS
jgi:hypothetical protein